MRRVLTAAMLLLALAAFTFTAAQADSGTGSSGGATAANYATRAAAFVVGTGLGTPISIFREQYKDSVQYTQALSGGSKNRAILAICIPPCIVCGLANGMMHGPLHAMKHAWQSEPFTKGTFSLGHHED